MIYNGHSDDQDIVSTIADSTGMNKTADIKKITRAANEANRTVWNWIFEAYGGWQYDDGNQSNLPSATAHLNSGQSKYTIPSDALTVRQVSVKDENGNWTDIDPITAEEIHSHSTENEFGKTPGSPAYYRLIGNIVELYPAPNYTQVRSLRMQFDRGSVAFTSTSTNTSPGFASEFHGAIPVGASFILGSDRTLRNRADLEKRWLGYETSVKRYYKARYAELHPENKRTQKTDPLSQLH